MHAFEEHGEVLSFWVRSAAASKTVVCFDRHLDIKTISGSAIATLSQAMHRGDSLDRFRKDVAFRDDGRAIFGSDNFLFAAFQLGIVEEVFWVVPDPKSASPYALARQLWDALSLVFDHGHEIMATFRVTETGACCKVAGARVHIATLRQLRHIKDLPGGAVVVDIDLDFFADQDGVMEETVEEFVARMRDLDLLHHLFSLSFSIKAGFLPDAFRDVAKSLAQQSGMSLRRHRHRSVGAQATMSAIARDVSLSPADVDHLWDLELRHLGGAGYSALAVLKARLGDRPGAEQAYRSATRGGDRSTWAAYTLGLRTMQAGEYADALEWFQACRHDETDTLGAHALILAAICQLRLGRHHDALAAADYCLDRLPMRTEICAIGACAARALRWEDRRACFQTHQLKIRDACGFRPSC